MVPRRRNSSSSSSAGSLPHRQSEAYRSNFFRGGDTGCITGFDYKEEVGCLELEDSELMLSSVAMQIEQQQLYQINTQKDMMRHQITEDFGQPWEFEEIFRPAIQFWQPSSSSSSSLRSLSMSSPEYSPLLLDKAEEEEEEEEAPTEQAAQPTTNIPIDNRFYDIQFPTSKDEDLAIARAMIAVISSTSSSSMLQLTQTHQHHAKCPPGAFKPYNSALAQEFQAPRKSLCGQKMINMSMTILRRINLLKDGAGKKDSRPSSQQLDHMISERRRREKLNGSFHTLRLLLPPGTKKDKASVLCKTRDYLKVLKAEIYELEEKNQMLEMHLLPTDETGDDVGGSIERVNIQIIEASESRTGVQQINLKITVGFECGIVELVLHMLECLKGMRFISFVSLDANIYSQQGNLFAWATLKLDIQSSDWDEVSFKEAMTRAVDLATPTP